MEQGYNYPVPENPLTCEEYGLILPENDPSWQNFVNSVIDLAGEKKIVKKWFSLLSNEFEKTQKFCQNKGKK